MQQDYRVFPLSHLWERVPRRGGRGRARAAGAEEAFDFAFDAVVKAGCSAASGTPSPQPLSHKWERGSRVSRFLLAVICALVSLSASAQVTFTISGEIQETVCTPTLTGSKYSGNILKLDPVQLDALDLANKTAGDTTVTFSVSNCGISAANTHMWVYFTSPQMDGGRIKPTVGPATLLNQVRFEIRDNTSTGALVQVGGPNGTSPTSNQGTGQQLTGTYPLRVASKNYVIRYYAKEKVTIAGEVSSPVTYTVKFY